ncbi:trans-resveratrol di-O-methyltransferase-like [Durio zibethinus]|uniref:Trans-resveratrol di-O-methyltransferase-like n=1 Tax=Durio zibethinus TaxID=66656 RepID=A0A6P5Z0K2_DURZI|nr:trans-resveratrol di-O-methyltransferase-like [Durio zibethinus]
MDVANVNAEHVNELLQAQAHVWNHIFNFMNSMSLKCAIDLGIPDIIQNHGKPMTVTDLVAALPINATKACSIYRLMRILVHSGFFAQQKLGENPQEEGYVLTNASRLLLKGDPLSVRPLLKAILDPVVIKPWHFLGTWFQNDDPTPFVTAHGRSFWDYGAHVDPNFGHSFKEAMASDARLVTNVLIHECKEAFKGLNSLVDVGGGTGTVAKGIADAFPQLECTAFDLPHVVAGLQGSGNLKYVGGDMFEAVPAADAVLLKWILHDWNDEECVKILKRCKGAISNRDKVGVKVIIIEMILMDQKQKVNDQESIETQLFFDMEMMVVATGRERNQEEWAKLFFAAGFTDYKITHKLGLRSLIEVYP